MHVSLFPCAQGLRKIPNWAPRERPQMTSYDVIEMAGPGHWQPILQAIPDFPENRRALANVTTTIPRRARATLSQMPPPNGADYHCSTRIAATHLPPSCLSPDLIRVCRGIHVLLPPPPSPRPRESRVGGRRRWPGQARPRLRVKGSK